MQMIPHDTHLQIGSLLFEGLDQIDLTGPFEVLSRIPNSTYRLYGKTAEPVRDLKGLRLTPDAVLANAPHSRKLPSAARGIDRDIAWSDRSSASGRITASVAGDLPRVSRAI